MADLLVGPVTVANLTAAAGVVTTVDGWWPCLNLTWRTPVPASITRIVAQVREKGSDGTISETVVTPGDGAAAVVNGVAVGQHLQVRLSPAGAPGLPFQPTPWVDVTTPWDALIAALSSGGGGVKLGCFTVVCGTGVPTRTDLPIGSLYVEESSGELWQYDAAVQRKTTAVNIVGTDLKTGTNIVTFSGYSAAQAFIFSKPSVASSGGLLSWDAWSRWSTDEAPGHSWFNTVSIYGNNGGSDVLLYSFADVGYADAATALAQLQAVLPFSASGYTTYKVAGVADVPASDNRGGLSIQVDIHTPGWVQISEQPNTGGSNLIEALASEDIAAGAYVDVYNNGGVLSMRNASAADDSKQDDGFVLEAVATGWIGRVHPPGTINDQLSGLTLDARYYLSPSSPGGITSTMPTTAGQWLRCVGKAIASTQLRYLPEPGRLLA